MRILGSRLRLYGAALVCTLSTSAAQAYEYPLWFTPAGDYKDLVVAGYQIAGKTVVGNCSYTQITSGSGRDPRTYYTPIPQTCTWDLYGDLLGTVAGEPVAPAPVGTNGTQTIYAAKSGKLYTGSDSVLATGGFVFTYGSHYVWLTSNAYMVLPQVPYTFTVTLSSNGDIPLTVTAVRATTKLAGAKVTLNSTTCTGAIPVGGTCDITVTYNDLRVTSTSGLAYDTLTIHVISNAGVTDEFVQSYTDEVRITPD
jgi:hypothetical protein